MTWNENAEKYSKKYSRSGGYSQKQMRRIQQGKIEKAKGSRSLLDFYSAAKPSSACDTDQAVDQTTDQAVDHTVDQAVDQVVDQALDQTATDEPAARAIKTKKKNIQRR